VLTAGSVANHELKPNGVYQGNPASWKRLRSAVDKASESVTLQK